MSTICFYARYEDSSGDGCDGLTVTWDVDRITRSDGTRSALVTAGANNITIGRRGLYGYRLTSADLTLYDYVATAITASATPTVHEVAALWTYWSEGAAVAGDAMTLEAAAISSTTFSANAITATVVADGAIDAGAIADAAIDNATFAADVGSTAYATNIIALAAAKSLVNYDLDHISKVSAGSEKPTDGTYFDQMMNKDSSQTFSSTTDSLEAMGEKVSTGAFSVTAAVDGDDVTVYRGTQWSITFSDLGSIADYSKLWFTAKDDASHPDSQAIVQVVKHSSGSGDGLVYINGTSAPSGWSTKASIAITSFTDGDGTITVDESATRNIMPREDKHYDIKVLRTTGAVNPLADGLESFTVKADVTRTVS